MNTELEFNPFSSRFVSPTTCRFLDFGTSAENGDLTHCLLTSASVQIIGPHGVGKSTLAVRIATMVKEHFGAVRMVTIRRSNRRWPRDHSISSENLFAVQQSAGNRMGPKAGPELIIMDGIEQLSVLHRWCLLQAFRKRQISVIITVHQPIKFIRKSIELQPSIDRFRAIARGLVSGTEYRLSEELIGSVYRRCEGNYRTGLSMLYDHVSQLAKTDVGDRKVCA